jgi:hypothetical protein
MHLSLGVGDTHLEKIGLEVCAHRRSGNANHQGRERIEAAVGKLRDSTAISPRGFQGCGGYCSEPTSQATRLKTHPNQAREPKHDSDAYVLNLLVGIRVASARAKAFHPRVGYPV